MTDYHGPPEELSEGSPGYSRMLKSIMEDIEAVDGCYQCMERAGTMICVTSFVTIETRTLSTHMGWEWLRRNRPEWAERLETYLFSDEDLVELEHEVEDGEEDGHTGRPRDVPLNIGGLRGDRSNPRRIELLRCSTGRPGRCWSRL